MFWLFAVAGLVSNLLLSGLGWADDSSKRFQLFAACLPMRVFVVMTGAPHAWRPIKQEVQKIMEEPLRQLNLYKAPDSYSNFIVLDISGKESGLIFMSFEYHKMLSDLASDVVSLSPTWREYKVVPPPRQPLVETDIQKLAETDIKVGAQGFILEFIMEYLEVNIQQCRAQLPATAFENWQQYFKEKRVAPLGALE